ncbi:MAG: aspartyl protease family protein, partial [Candidatus Latescibacterota bacterium]
MRLPLMLLVLIYELMIFASVPAAAQFEAGGEVVFTNGRRAPDIPFELNSDKIYLQVRLNGKGPYWLVLDTGSPGMILDTRVGQELGIGTGEGFQVGGAGELGFTLAPADSTLDASLFGIELLKQPAHVGGIDAVVGSFEGRTIDGVLGGYNIFANYIVEVDYGNLRISIYEREDYAVSEHGTAVPVRIDGGH